MKGDSPLVSVIIPNYNHSAYLDQRIESVLEQTFQDFEIILLDDSSTDESVSVINQYKEHPKVSHVLLNEQNSGSTFVQWEKGMKLAKGKFLWIAESDDFSEKELLEKLLPSFEDETVGCCFCGSLFVDKDGALLRKSEDEDSDFKLTKDNFFAKGFHQKNLIRNASAVLIRRKVVEDFPKGITNMTFLGDWLFWLSILRNDYSICYKSLFLNNFRIHSNNVSTNAVKNDVFVKEGVYVYKYIKNEFLLSKDQSKELNKYWFEKFLFSYFPFRPLSTFNVEKLKGLLRLIRIDPILFFNVFLRRLKFLIQ